MSAANEETPENEKEAPRLSYTEKRKKLDEQKRVLDPDNPMLQKFQKALKEHLLRQIETLKQDISEYETGASKKVVLKEELGVQVYDAQQVVAKQQTVLDNCINELEKITANREETEKYLQERKKIHNEERLRLIEAENEESRLKKEVDSTNFLIYQVSQWENTIERDLNTKHRMLEKSNQDKTKLLQEKRIQDALIYRLTMKVWQIETEIEQMKMHYDIHEEEREHLAQTVALGNTNIEAVASEYKNLSKVWNSVIIAITNRDKVVECLNSELQKLEEKFKVILTQIDRSKKITNEEMHKNEYLIVVKNRAIEDIAHFKALIQEEMTKKTTFERKINEMQGIIERTEKDIEKERQEKFLVEKVNQEQTRTVERMVATKKTLEDDIALKLTSEAYSDNVLKKLHKLLKKAQDNACSFEIVSIESKREIDTVEIKIEDQKISNYEMEKHQEEIEEQIIVVESKAQALEKKQYEMRLAMVKADGDSVILQAKLAKILSKIGSAEPYNQKILDLENEIVNVKKEVPELKAFWLIGQTNLLNVSQERQEQIIRKNQLRRETAIMEQQCLKLSDITNGHKKKCEKITRDINLMQHKLKNLSEKNFKDKGMRELLLKRNEVVQEQYVNRLKDVELECLALESEISGIDEDKVNLSDCLIELNRENLEWEKKLLHAKETQETVKCARGQGGALNSLKSDINRMTLRYSNLKKTQEKLINDLTHCITRRDVMFSQAAARERAAKDGFDKTRLNFSRKMDNMRNKVKQIEYETEELKKKVEHVDLELRSGSYDVNDLERGIVSDKKTLAELKVELEESKTQRQMSFEFLLQLQKKLALYNELARNRRPYTVYSKDWELSINLDKHKGMNAKLRDILQKLKEEFPCYEQELIRLLNTLRIPLLAAM